MNWKAISRSVGSALLVSAFFMFLSVLVSIWNGYDSALAPLSISCLLTLISGGFPFIFVRRTSNISLKDGYLIVSLSWLLSFIFGMLPFALWGGPFTVVNAWFESVSGFTTTGASILEDVEALPLGLQFWRCSTHFIGGLGVVVFLLLVIPNSSPMRLKLTNMELSSLSRGGYSVRANKTVFIFAYVYIAIFVAAFFSYWAAGMSMFDAVCHAFSVCATGGFSTKNLSIGAYNSVLIESITVLFMYLSTLHFGLLFLTVVTRSLKPLNNPVLKFYTWSLVAASLMVSLALKFDGVAHTWGEALRYGCFQSVSIITTTGFSITDTKDWSMLANVILMTAALGCGCAGSTGGGMKVDRVVLFFKSIGRYVNKILHPSAVGEVKLGKRVLRDDELFPHFLYICLYFCLLLVSVVLAKIIGVSDMGAVSGSVFSLGNVGAATIDVGSLGNYNSFPAAAKFLFSFDMFLGRVEIFPVLATIGLLFDRSARKK